MSESAIEAEHSIFACELPPKPYPGLRPFEKAEWPIFFGRERMVDEVVERLLKARFLVVHGDSGSGKSSLIAAGVLPRLEQDLARGGARWRTCSATPGNDPLWNLARALSAIDKSGAGEARQAEIRRVLNFGRDGVAPLSKLLRRDTDDHVCILFDQFEELFARGQDSSEAALLVELLIGIQQQRVDGIYAVLTMRSEFLGACARFRGFAEAVNASQYLLPRMEHADLLRAIQAPIELYDGRVDRELAEWLIADAARSQDQLPLIQHGLMLVHSKQLATRSGLTPSDGLRLSLDSLGSPPRPLAELLSMDANEIADAATRRCGESPPTSRIVEDIFRALTDVNAEGQAIRRPQTLAQLVAVTGADEAKVRSIIDAFRAEGASLLRPYGKSELSAQSRIDISHEALIRCWRRLSDPAKGWLDAEFRNGLVWRSLLVQADSFDKNPSSLLSAETAEERAKWLKRRNPAWCARYGGGWERVTKLVDASVRQAAQNKKRELELELKARTARLYRSGLLALIVFTLVAVALAVMAYDARRRASEQRANAVAEKEKAKKALAVALAERAIAKDERADRVELESALKATAQNAAPSSELRTQLEKIIASSEKAPAAKPRVYIHFSSEQQRQGVLELARRLQGASLAGGTLQVPPSELRATTGRSELRCFRHVDCAAAGELSALIGQSLKSGAPHVADYSEQFENSTKLRPGHYELWLSSEAL